MTRRAAALAIFVGALAVSIVCMVVAPRIGTHRPAAAAIFVAGGLGLALYRKAPVVSVGVATASWPVAAALSSESFPLPDVMLLVVPAVGAVAGARLKGAESYAALVVLLVSANAISTIAGDGGSPVMSMLVLAGFVGGLVVRRRREVADALAERSRELDEERELFADLSVRYERARIAAELHDIVAHAISVMVVQAAAGQRLVQSDPTRVPGTFSVIADAARRGSEDLSRLVALLGGDDGRIETSDLDLIDEVVQRAGRSGLDVTCRFEGERSGVGPEAARAAFRVVQEGLTNALRHAPGSAVAIVVRSENANGRGLIVRVENGPMPDGSRVVVPAGTGTGLRGLRERIQALGGSSSAGPSETGGWVLEAVFPSR